VKPANFSTSSPASTTSASCRKACRSRPLKRLQVR
jgi:hypothetical protein